MEEPDTMSDTASCGDSSSEGSISDSWTVVTKSGEVESGNGHLSSSSSGEFVHLDDDIVSFQVKKLSSFQEESPDGGPGEVAGFNDVDITEVVSEDEGIVQQQMLKHSEDYIDSTTNEHFLAPVLETDENTESVMQIPDDEHNSDVPLTPKEQIEEVLQTGESEEVKFETLTEEDMESEKSITTENEGNEVEDVQAEACITTNFQDNEVGSVEQLALDSTIVDKIDEDNLHSIVKILNPQQNGENFEDNVDIETSADNANSVNEFDDRQCDVNISANEQSAVEDAECSIPDDMKSTSDDVVDDQSVQRGTDCEEVTEQALCMKEDEVENVEVCSASSNSATGLESFVDTNLSELSDEQKDLILKDLTNRLSRDNSVSDESDFVKIEQENSSVEEVNMPSSQSSSVHSNFDFIRQNVNFAAVDREDANPDENIQLLKYIALYNDSVTSDVDDRVESDISGIADDSDLSSLFYALGDAPLDDGRRIRTYRHRPNSNLNYFLTIVAIIAVSVGVGMGIGHFIGSARGGHLRQRQGQKLRDTQDDYLICLGQQEKLEQKPLQLEKEILYLKEMITQWQSKYNALMSENIQQEVQMVELKNTQEKFSLATAEELKQSKMEIEMNSDELTQQRTLESQLQSKVQGMEWQVTSLEEEKQELLDANELLKNNLNQVQLDNAYLREGLAKLRYTEHPANRREPALRKQDLIVLKDKLNDAMTENQDLKSEVRKLRYQPVHLEKPSSEKSIVESLGTEKAKTPGENHVQDTSDTGIHAPTMPHTDDRQKDIKELRHQLELERGRSMTWQTMFVAERTRNDGKTKKQPTEQLPTFFACMNLIMPSVLKELEEFTTQNVTVAFQDIRVFLNNLTYDGQFSETLREKWEEFERYAKTYKYSDYTDKATAIYDDIVDTIKEKWHKFQDYTHSQEFHDQTESAKDSLNQFVHQFKEKLSNIKDFGESDEIKDYVHKTKESIVKLSERMQGSWEQLRSLSNSLIEEHEPVYQSIKNQVQGHLLHLGNTLQKNVKNLGKTLKKQTSKWFGNKHKEQNLKRKTKERDDDHVVPNKRPKMQPDYSFTQHAHTHDERDRKTTFKAKQPHKPSKERNQEYLYITADEILEDDKFGKNKWQKKKKKKQKAASATLR